MAPTRSHKALTFGDTVRVRATAVTEEASLAGLVGTIYGETTPSQTGVVTIGALESDYAVNVYFEESDRDAWFEPKLLEFVDHGAGMELQIEGAPAKWVRNAEGEWVEHSERGDAAGGQPWWKFW